jgi:hypothetical protein
VVRVYVDEVSVLKSRLLAIATALTVSEELIVMGAVYRVEDEVAADPFVV